MTNTNKSLAVSVKSLLSGEASAYRKRFNEILGARAPQFVASVIGLGNSMPDVNPQSIIGACAIAATLDLPVDKNLGFAWVIPFKDKKGDKQGQFQIGAKGYTQLAQRTGQYKLLNVTEIYEGELVRYDKLRGIVEVDPEKRTSDKVSHIAAFMQTISGFEHSEIWTVKDVHAHAKKFSKNYDDAKSVWKSNFNAMAKKTVLKSMLCHYGPMSVDIATAVAHDGAIKPDIDATTIPEFADSASIDVDTVKPAEVDESPATVVDVKPADQPPKDTDKTPQEKLLELMQADGVSIDKLLAFAEEKNLVIKGATGLDDFSNSNANKLVNNWVNVLKSLRTEAK